MTKTGTKVQIKYRQGHEEMVLIYRFTWKTACEWR